MHIDFGLYISVIYSIFPQIVLKIVVTGQGRQFLRKSIQGWEAVIAGDGSAYEGDYVMLQQKHLARGGQGDKGRQGDKDICSIKQGSYHTKVQSANLTSVRSF